jgi:hypothetical protein
MSEWPEKHFVLNSPILSKALFNTFPKLPNLHTVPNQLDKSWYKSETLKSGERLDEKSGRLVRWGNSVSFIFCEII